MKKAYCRVKMENGKLATGMYTRSDLAATPEIAREVLRGIWEKPGASYTTAIVEHPEDKPEDCIILEIITVQVGSGKGAIA